MGGQGWKRVVEEQTLHYTMYVILVNDRIKMCVMMMMMMIGVGWVRKSE